MIAVRTFLVYLSVSLAVFSTLSLCVYAENPDLYLHKQPFLSSYDSDLPIEPSWIIKQYDFDQIEEYIDEYYVSYYKYWENYIADKQKELAGKFFLSDIIVKPNLRRYENTKLVLSRRFWNDRILLRYLAPLGNMGDCELLVSFKPYRFTKIVASGHMNGEKSIVLVINKTFGSEDRNKKSDDRTRKVLNRAKKILRCD